MPRLNEVLSETLDNIMDLVDETGAFESFLSGGEPKNSGIPYCQPPAEWTGDPLDWDCVSGGGNASAWPSKDLSLLCATAFAYGFYYTGETRFKDDCKMLWGHALSRTVEWPTVYYSGNKQFNQSFYRSWRIPYLLGGSV